MPRPSDTLRIAVTFPAPGEAPGPARASWPLTEAKVARMRPAEADTRRALEALQRLGFEVTTTGRLSASVRGPRRLIERIFQAKLRSVRMRDFAHPSSILQAEMAVAPAEGAPWDLPAEIAGLVDSVEPQWPHIYHARWAASEPAPVPPALPDRHALRVPDDVAVLLDAASVHRQGFTGQGVRVAMIDTGFEHTHPFFTARGYASRVVAGPGAGDPTRDPDGHGTGESANLFAVAPDAQVIGVKLETDDGEQGASLLEGLHVALEHDPDILTISLGYDLALPGRVPEEALPTHFRALEAELTQVVAEGRIVVLSAGNGQFTFPAMMPDVIAAGGVHVRPDGAMEASDYASAFTSAIYEGRDVPDVCGLVGMLPGAQYLVLPVPPGSLTDRRHAATDGTAPDDGWAVFSGTSAAAPQVAGVCALLRQIDESLDTARAKALLRETARDVTRGAASHLTGRFGEGLSASEGDDVATGAGLVSAAAAVARLQAS